MVHCAFAVRGVFESTNLVILCCSPAKKMFEDGLLLLWSMSFGAGIVGYEYYPILSASHGLFIGFSTSLCLSV